MKGFSITDRIRYIHCEGEDGAHGILVLLGTAQWATRAVEIETNDDFKREYTLMAAEEKTQDAILGSKTLTRSM